METILIPQDMFDWIVQCAEKDARYNTFSVTPCNELRWEEEVSFLPKTRANMQRILSDPELRSDMLKRAAAFINEVARWDSSGDGNGRS